MEFAAAVEKRRPVRETPLQRLGRKGRRLLAGLIRLSLLAAILTPVLLSSILAIDIPNRSFDHYFSITRAKPGNWLSNGLIIMALAPFVVILLSRRFGGEEASRVITASWALTAFAAFAGISYLSPALEPGDLPNVSFTVAFVLSAIVAQFTAAGVFDITRGSEAWWRAPFFAALSAFVVGALIYFPIAFWNSNAPWPNWLVQYVALTTLMSVVFLGPYKLLMRRLRPRGGFGG